jgi:CRISPR-associated endonuclease/helicase Cas3
LAKTYQTQAGQKQAGRPVLNHCQIVGAVAKALLARQPDWLRAALFPQGAELIAAAHDIGKASPTFQEKIYRGTDGYRRNSMPGLESAQPEIEKHWGGHAGVSQATAQALKLGRYIPEILGQHHGYSPDLGARIASDETFGGRQWQQLRQELLGQLQAALQAEFPVVNDELQAKVLAGLTTVADWIGSGSLFEDPAEDWRPKIEPAIDSAGFLKPEFKPGLSFAALFGFQLRPAQQVFIDSVQQPGVYVLEAPMGLGKTEAALFAAYQMLLRGQASGLYFALPTQLTSDKIHGRVAAFLQKILESGSPHRQPLLLHGSAWLKSELGKEGNPGGAWFQAGKRGILAPFAVGTLDQALMAVMNVKHGFVRAFGLAGKVVILDEVHAYDSYTGTILDELIAALRRLHCTVLILSATLTQERRASLLGADTRHAAYPLVCAAPTGGRVEERPAGAIADVEVQVQHCGDEAIALDAALARAEQGQQVLWIENTVAEAQQAYRLLASHAANCGIACGLLHSRFLKIDRERNEQHWVRLFGQEGASQRGATGRILIGTQVLEQSLDIDADFLVSRFAPSDMLLQRIGRLWRHSATPRPAKARREILLLAPELAQAIADPGQAFGKTAKVYNGYVLCRSLEVWQTLARIAVPGQIRAIIEATYAEREETGPLLQYRQALDKKRAELRGLALLGLSKAGKTLPEEKASTRYSEQDSVEVLLVKSYRLDRTRRGAWVEFCGGQSCFLPSCAQELTLLQRRKLAADLLNNTVRVAEYLAPSPTPLQKLDWLREYVYLGKSKPGREESLLRFALAQDSGALLNLDNGPASDRYALEYDDRLGYQAR